MTCADLTARPTSASIESELNETPTSRTLIEFFRIAGNTAASNTEYASPNRGSSGIKYNPTPSSTNTSSPSNEAICNRSYADTRITSPRKETTPTIPRPHDPTERNPVVPDVKEVARASRP